MALAISGTRLGGASRRADVWEIFVRKGKASGFFNKRDDGRTMEEIGKEGERAAFICLGANLGDCEKTLARARALIAEIEDSKIERVSRVYRSQPQELNDQPWFLNQVIKTLPGARWRASAYLDELLKIETRLGRTRDGSRYGPRIIDADLLLFGGEICQTETCVTPHPKLCQRAFALAPLREIAPDVRINGKRPDEWLKQLNWRVEDDKIWQENGE